MVTVNLKREATEPQEIPLGQVDNVFWPRNVFLMCTLNDGCALCRKAVCKSQVNPPDNTGNLVV